MLPIPKTLLIHSVDYYEPIKDSRYEGEFKDPIKVKNVLVNYSKSVNKSNGSQQEKQTIGKLIVDCINSDPAIEMTYGSKIIFNDVILFVKACKPVYAFTLHHYEVDLM